jgi:hypothetical protein
MTEDQRRALAPLLFELGPMLEIFSELEAGDASHYTPALHLGLTEWRRIKEAFQPLLSRPDHIGSRREGRRKWCARFGIADAVPLLRCTGGRVAPIGERLQRIAHAGCRRRLRPRGRPSSPRHRAPVSRIRAETTGCVSGDQLARQGAPRKRR